MSDLNRIKKVNEVLKREIGTIFSRETDFANTLITVTRVEASSNFIQAKIYISVFPEEEEGKVFHFLNKNIYFLQQILNKKIKMRPVPKMIFVKEIKVKEAGEIEEVLETLKKEEK